jgi:hypothetical protein
MHHRYLKNQSNRYMSSAENPVYLKPNLICITSNDMIFFKKQISQSFCDSRQITA